jgi:hypothetical protein
MKAAWAAIAQQSKTKNASAAAMAARLARKGKESRMNNQKEITSKIYQHNSLALEDVRQERARQIHQEGWTAAHDDDCHETGDLACSGGAYALNAGSALQTGTPVKTDRPYPGWAFSIEYWKPKGARRDLVIAAALIIAEIEKMDRCGYIEERGSNG